MRASQSTSTRPKPKKVAMKNHPAGQSNVPADPKSSATKTTNSASRATKPLAKGGMRQFVCILETGSHKPTSPLNSMPQNGAVISR